MLFDSFRITPRIQLDSQQVSPGDDLTGVLFLISTAKDPVTVQEIWVKLDGVCTTTRRRRSRYQHSQEREDSHDSSANVECGGDVKSPDTQIGVAPKSLTPEHQSGKCEHEITPHARNSATSRSDTESVSVVVAKARVPLQLQPTTLKQGMHAFKFVLRIPVEHEGEPLLPSFTSPELRTSVKYTVTGLAKLSMLVRWSDSSRIFVRPTATVAPSRQTPEVQRTLQVGTWLRESTTLWPLMRYAFGGDTAARWSDVTLYMTVGDLVCGDLRSSYLQDALRLRLRCGSKDAPSMFVDSMKISIFTTTQVRNSKDASDVPPSNSHLFQIMNSRHVDFPVNFSKEKDEIDISAVLSGVRMASVVPPSITLPSVQVQHWLKVSIGLRSSSPDGTRQAPAVKGIETAVRVLPEELATRGDKQVSG